ncbi:AAA family ATPase [Deinococcus sp. AJ005]|uniref:AAA family ATPase n=1 Tax=Deinococcus sp. AJ005 TaxID=2652443 RepID=UPI00125CC493|nr:AAA family ATPase [Deinococcus sp. AJ005]QFP76852.1 ATP-binding protein [Deinococcus sp. AJ005]
MKTAPVLIVITGLPAAGKTTLAAFLGRELALPVISKDDYKQVLLDLLPEEERLARHSEMGKAGYFVMLRAAEAILTARQSLILETHFYPGMSEQNVIPLAEKHHAQILQIHCFADMTELKRRHAVRVESQLRPFIDHSGVHDKLPENANWEPLELHAPLLRLDTGVSDAHAQALA